MIEQNDISFIVCGRIEPVTKKGLKSIRKYFPHSKIILSTWDDCKIDNLTGLYDVLVINNADQIPNKDIKCSVDPHNPKINSLNLQMSSVHAGLKKSKTLYSVRFRTDFVLKNANFLRVYNKLNSFLGKRKQEFKLFSQKILVPTVYTRDPEKCGGGYAYDVSDIFAFGKTEDLLKRWNGIMVGRESLEYFGSPSEKPNYFNPHSSNSQYTMEQYGLINLLKDSSINVPLPNSYMDNTDVNFIKNTYEIFLSNFYIVSLKTLGISSKFSRSDKKDLCLFRYHKYLQLYQKFFPQNNFQLKVALIKEDIIEAFKNLFKKGRKK